MDLGGGLTEAPRNPELLDIVIMEPHDDTR